MHRNRSISIAALALLAACSGQGLGRQPNAHNAATAPITPIENPEVQQPPAAEATTSTTEATPETVPTTEAPTTTVVVTAPPTTRVRVTTTVAAVVDSGDVLACIRSYEQGAAGYATDTGNGYYGAYQFDLSTWASVGGSGNPANASPAEQDMRAQMLLDRRGLAPWPTPARMCR